MTHASLPGQPIVLHDFALSCHCHRIRLFLSLLGLPNRVVPVDLARGEHKSPEFLKLNAFGLVPVIQDGEVTLADSNAILVYLASRYGDAHWYPKDDAQQAAEVQRWLSVAAGPLAFGPAAARLVTVFGAKLDAEQAITRAHALFRVMEASLQQQPYLAGNTPTIADVANYSYTAHAPEGGVSLAEYPQVRAWLARIEALPGFVAMAQSPLKA